MMQTGTTFAAACDEWIAYKRDRKVKLSTQIDYEHMTDRMRMATARGRGALGHLERCWARRCACSPARGATVSQWHSAGAPSVGSLR